ncbi:MAG: hypothetical protein SOT34_07410, partial [Candidatus Borkfalkiaceae bacterium]|nr:hypothetical protein [Christensenellaceae bacterium]
PSAQSSYEILSPPQRSADADRMELLIAPIVWFRSEEGIPFHGIPSSLHFDSEQTNGLSASFLSTWDSPGL